jgi:flagellin
MLSLHTNTAALAAQRSITTTQSSLSTAQTRLSTGFRVNTAMDDAAGLQIATRLQAQSKGMQVAQRNTQNSISLLQTADGALNEVGDILIRMKDLATQAADGSSTSADADAMQGEYDSLADELSNIMENTSFGGTPLFLNTTAGKLNAPITFQIGASSAEHMVIDVSTDLAAVHASLFTASWRYQDDGEVTAPGLFTEIVAGHASATINNVATAIDNVSALRSKLGAAANRLDHVYNNLSNVSANTKAATGRIIDTDFASTSADMTSGQMLLQAGTAMLKQSNSMASVVMSLLQ